MSISAAAAIVDSRALVSMGEDNFSAIIPAVADFKTSLTNIILVNIRTTEALITMPAKPFKSADLIFENAMTTIAAPTNMQNARSMSANIAGAGTSRDRIIGIAPAVNSELL